MTYPYRSLPKNLAAFCARLRREHGFLIGPRELQEAARALEITAIADERAVRDALRPVLSASREDLRTFDLVFDEFFFGGRRAAWPADSAARTSNQFGGPAGASRDSRDRRAASDPAADGPAGPTDQLVAVSAVSAADENADRVMLRASYSPFHADGDIPDLGPVDDAWRDAAATLVRRVRAGSSRRWRPAARGQRFDLRRTLRRSLPAGGDMLIPRWRTRQQRRPRFVVLVDGSRSMAGLTGPALHTALALTAAAPDTETFVFSTALRRVTPELRRAVSGERRRLHLHRAWGGGTAIGPSLREFVDRFGDRLLGRRSVIVISSDGLDVGEPAVLRDAMAALARRSAAVVWLNPLLDTAGYEPTALGMSTARPFVTALASVNDAAGLVRLSRVIRIA